MSTTESRSDLYATAGRATIGIPAVIGLFAAAFAVIVFAIGMVPVNMMLAKMVNPSAVAVMWRNSMNQLVVRAAVAALGCWLALAISRRSRGRLSGKGMLALGVGTSGAFAGAADVALHKLWVRQMIQAYHHSHLAGNAVSLGITLAAAMISAGLLLSTRMRVADAAQLRTADGDET
ncbi:MAG: hypothetical protein M3R65_09550 [Gemmatimonadota bacterium]|nr:hypothetical protein [Gemmatimonadota bacterium]